MPSLHELQRRFSAAALFADASATASLGIVAAGLSPAARMAVYCNNVHGNYRKVLAATYPVIARLVGSAFFAAACEHFVRAYPSSRGDVNRYGGKFASFVESYAPARELAYLPDVARLEWAIDQASIAGDVSTLDLDALAGVAPERLGALRFVLHPSVTLLRSVFPVLRIWQTNQADYRGDDSVDLGEGGDALLVQRGDLGVSAERLARAEHALLTALAANAQLDKAAARAAEVDAGFDLAAVLRKHVASHAIVAFRAPAITHSNATP